METRDPPPESEEPVDSQEVSRPWGPGSPAPGTRVAGYGIAPDETKTLQASKASELYEAARFPELEEVVPDGQQRPTPAAPGPEQEAGSEKGGLRILGVPAPKEIAGPVLAALALVAALYGWRRRRRRWRR